MFSMRPSSLLKCLHDPQHVYNTHKHHFFSLNRGCAHSIWDVQHGGFQTFEVHAWFTAFSLWTEGAFTAFEMFNMRASSLLRCMHDTQHVHTTHKQSLYSLNRGCTHSIWDVQHEGFQSFDMHVQFNKCLSTNSTKQISEIHFWHELTRACSLLRYMQGS